MKFDKNNLLNNDIKNKSILKKNKLVYIILILLFVVIALFFKVVVFKSNKNKDWYNDMLKSSIVSTGNNARLKKVLEKVKNGEDVYIAAIGGSITECGDKVTYSDGYIYQFIKEFSLKYGVNDGENIHFVNAGLSGTTSSLGTIRYKRDIIDELDHELDLLFIEYSVNDAEEQTSLDAYESLIYDGLIESQNSAVVLIHSVVRSKWNMQDDYIPYGNYYNLPMISMKDAIEEPIQNGLLTDDLFFIDDYHPTVYGQTIMKDCLMYLIDVIDNEELDEISAIPDKPITSRKFSHMIMVDENNKDIILDKGSFDDTDNIMQFYWKNHKIIFPNNFKKSENTENKSFKLSLYCKTLLADFKTDENDAFGDVEIYVDGQYVMTFNGNKKNGWCDSNVVLIIDGEEACYHDVEIKMANGHEDKTFTIYAIGYNT